MNSANFLQNRVEELARRKVLSICPLTPEASNRKYFRVYLQSGQETILCVISDSFSQKSDFWMIGNYLQAKNLSVPRVEAWSSDGYLLLSDVGRRNFQETFRQATFLERKNLVLQVAQIVTKMQSDSSVAIPACVAQRFFDKEKLLFEMDFFGNALKYASKEREFLYAKWYPYLEEICSFLVHALSKKSVFVHRDYHTLNLMVTDLGEISVIDFQDARMGLSLYDPISLYFDPYVEYTEQEKDILYAYFSQEVSDFEEEIWHKQAFQRLVKVLGTYVFQVFSKNNFRYAASIHAALQRILWLEKKFIRAKEFYEDFIFLPEIISKLIPKVKPCR